MLVHLTIGNYDLNRKRTNCSFIYSVKRFNIPYREPENGLGPLDNIDHPDSSVFRNLENIYEMVLEAKSKLLNLAGLVTDLAGVLISLNMAERNSVTRSDI